MEERGTDKGPPSASTTGSNELAATLESRLLQVDAGLEHVHNALDAISEEVPAFVPGGIGSHNHNRVDNNLVNNGAIESERRRRASLLQEAARQLSRAHDMLDAAVPELSMSMSMSHQQPQISSNGYGDEGGRAGAALHVGQVLPRCCQVLEAWSKLSWTGYTLRKRTTEASAASTGRDKGAMHYPPELRGVPQRAQYLLDRMEGTPGLAPPPTRAYHCVMECWAYSHEHRRATMAEGIFQRLHGSSSSSSSGSGGGRHQSGQQQQQRSRRPSFESHRIMVHAWGKSTRDPRAAFHATGHLMKMVKLVQQQQGQQQRRREESPRRDWDNPKVDDDYDDGNKVDDDDAEICRIEPNMDDFRIVMEAWTRAE
jgi:hypothetical protein